MRAVEDDQRAKALDQVAARLPREQCVAWWPGRLLVTTRRLADAPSVEIAVMPAVGFPAWVEAPVEHHIHRESFPMTYIQLVAPPIRLWALARQPSDVADFLREWQQLTGEELAYGPAD